MYDNREVIKKAEIEDTLNNLFENDNNTLAKGVTALYKYICSRYINITRSEVQDYLRKIRKMRKMRKMSV
jgi:flagellin-specific chaperone FliS